MFDSWSHLQVAHEVLESRRALLLHEALQADDEGNRVLHQDLLMDLWVRENTSAPGVL